MTSVVRDTCGDENVLVSTNRPNVLSKVGEEDSAMVHSLTQQSNWVPVIRNTYMEIKCVKFSAAPTDLFQSRLKSLPHFIVNLINKFLVGRLGFHGCHSDFCMSEEVSGRTNLGPSYLKSVKVKNYLHMVADAHYNENNKFNKYQMWYHHSEMGMSIMTLDAAAYILERFCNFLETVSKLDLKWKRINDSQAVAMANALKINVSLQSLDFSRNEIRQRGAIALAEALKENRSLLTLKLNDNSINDVACVSFGEMLLVNSTLLELDLGGNRISDAGADALLSAISMNDTLNNLNIASNRGISEEWKLNFLKGHETNDSETRGSAPTLINRVIISNYDVAAAYDPR